MRNKEKRFGKVIIILLAILLMSLGLRMYHIDKESLWTDEAFSISHAQEESITQVISKVSATEAAPPGYYLMLHHWTKIFGNSEAATRLPSLIFGVLGVLLLFLIVKEIFEPEVALLSALIMAISMQQVLYSQEARLYAMFTFFSLLSTYFFVKSYYSLNNKKTFVRNQALFVSSMIVNVYTNYMSLFLIIGYTGVLLWRSKEIGKTLKNWICVNSIIWLVALPLIPLIKNQITSSMGSGATKAFISIGVPTFLAQFGIFMFALPFLGASFILGLAIILIENININFRKVILSFPRHIFIILMFFISIVYVILTIKPFAILGIPLFRVPIIQSYFMIRHSLFLAPIIYVFVSYKIIKFPSKFFIILGIGIIVVFSAVSLNTYYDQPTKTQWREAVSYIKTNSGHQSTVLIDKGGFSNSFLATYYGKYDIKIVKMTESKRGGPVDSLTIEEVKSKISINEDFWLILSKNKKTLDEYYVLFEGKYFLKEFKSFKGITLYRFTTI